MCYPPPRKKGGFTLIEMLIVVAIIAILIAVSIPLVSSALERARVATDAANERACKAEAIICFLNGKVGTTDFSNTATYGYNAQEGKLVSTADDLGVAYGKCTADHGVDGSFDQGHKGMHLFVSVTKEGEVYMKWATGGTNISTSSAVGANSGLHGLNVDVS